MKDMIWNIKENISKVIIGKEEVVHLLLASLAAGGHVLLEDMPGTGKTMLAKALAKSMDLTFERIQFTPDLLPGDVTGLSFFHQGKGEFVFKEGPVFTNILLADEISRAAPRTQSSLLECMGEKQVTADGVTRALESVFFVIATENPIETLGCYPLPEAQLDRFMMKIPMGGLTVPQERQMLDRFITEEPIEQIQPVCGPKDIENLQKSCRQIYVHADLRDYMVNLAQATRTRGAGELSGVSPRGTLALLRAAQGYALVCGRSYVVPEDIKAVALPVLCHRMIAPMEDERRKREVIRALLSEVALPTEDWSR